MEGRGSAIVCFTQVVRFFAGLARRRGALLSALSESYTHRGWSVDEAVFTAQSWPVIRGSISGSRHRVVLFYCTKNNSSENPDRARVMIIKTRGMIVSLWGPGCRHPSAGRTNQVGPSGAASAVSAPAGSDAPPCWTILTLPPEPRFPSRQSESLGHKA